ncbi:hypothetical protein MSIM_04720 [Mycobacterium simiae]|nr:hypothetical protein MSIM_04720 [Mycobacterium simiae]
MGAAPWGRAPELVTKRGSAGSTGMQALSSVVATTVNTTVNGSSAAADLLCRLMPTTVAIPRGLAR